MPVLLSVNGRAYGKRILRRGSLMKIGIAEVAYAAGLLEGEGNFGLRAVKNILVVQCSMTDKEPLERLQSTFGGNLGGPYIDQQNPRHKPSWRWSINKREDVISVCQLVYSFMSPRRQAQIERLLSFNKSSPKHESQGHGSISKYTRGCRCADCRGAWSGYMREWRKKKCA